MCDLQLTSSQPCMPCRKPGDTARRRSHISGWPINKLDGQATNVTCGTTIRIGASDNSGSTVRSTHGLGDFRGNFLTMLGGTLMAQVIPLAVSPVLTRLYSPREFALMGLFLAVAGPIGVAVSARYELALMLPEDDADAAAVFWLAWRTAAALSSLIALVLIGVRVPVARALGDVAIAPWLLLVPVSVFLTGTYQVCNYWLNRHKHFRRIAAAGVSQQAGVAASSIGLSKSPFSAGGLISGAVIGQVIATGVLLARVFRGDLAPAAPRAGSIRLMARRYHQFPLYNLPYSFLGTLSSGLALVALSSNGFLAAAGYLSLARRMMLAPVTLLSASLGQVFYQEASVTFGSNRLGDLLIMLLRRISVLCTPGFIFGAYWAPDLFAILFGERWRAGGVYAAAFSPVAFCFLFTSWPERIFEVAERQHLALILQVVSDALGVGLLFLLLHLGVEPSRAVLCYSLTYVAYHTTYLVIVFRLASVPLRRLAAIGRLTFTTGAATVAILGVLHTIISGSQARFAIGAGFLAAYLVLMLRAHWRA